MSSISQLVGRDTNCHLERFDWVKVPNSPSPTPSKQMYGARKCWTFILQGTQFDFIPLIVKNLNIYFLDMIATTVAFTFL